MSSKPLPTEAHGMATEQQVITISEFVRSPNFSIPLASFLKSITGGRASAIDELTKAQAADVVGVIKKFKSKKK